MAVTTKYTVKVPLNLGTTPGSDQSVIWDESEKEFALGTGTGITINNYANDRITTATSDPSTLTAESHFRYVATGTGTTPGKVDIGSLSTQLATPYQLLTIGNSTYTSQLIAHSLSGDDPFVRFGLNDSNTLVIGFGAKTNASNKKFQIGTYPDQTSTGFTPYLSMNHVGRIGIGEDYVGTELTNPNSLVEISGNYTYNNASTSPLEVTNLNPTTFNADNRVLVLRMYSVGNPFQGYNNKPRFIDFQSRSGTGTYASRGNIALAPYSSGVFFNTNSDKRLKKNFKPFSLGLPELLQINPLEYEWKDNLAKSRGFIAQELYEIYPDAVYKPPTNDLKKDQWGIDYGKLTPLLVKSIQDQQEIINELEKRINNLENKSK